jgi:hypothetical protein
MSDGGSRTADRRSSEKARFLSPNQDDGSGFQRAIRRDAERRNLSGPVHRGVQLIMRK